MATAEVRQSRCQARPDAMSANFRRDGRLRQYATMRTSAAMRLILRHVQHNLRQFDNLKPLWLRIARTGLTRQRRLTAAANVRYERFCPRDLLGGEEFFQMRRVARLPAAWPLLLFLLLRNRRPRAQRVGRWRRRRIRRIGLEPRFQHAQPPLQFRDTSIALFATRALRAIHAAMLLTPDLRSCASFP